MWFLLKKLLLACIQTFTDNVFFKLGMMIAITNLYIVILVLMTLNFIQGHSCMSNQKLWFPFSPSCCY